MKKVARLISVIVMMVSLLDNPLCDANTAGLGLILKGSGKVLSRSGVGRTAKAVGRAFTKIPPHLYSQAVRIFGKNGARLLENAPLTDTTRLVAYANKTNNPSVRNTLLNYYKKGGTQFLDQLSWQKVLAVGLSTSMIIGAYQTSDGIQTGMKNVSEISPEVFASTVTRTVYWITMPLVLGFGVYFVGWAVIRLRFYYKKKKRNWES